MSRRDHLLDARAHLTVIAKQVKDEEWDQQQIDDRGGQVNQTKETASHPAEGDSPELGLARRSTEAAHCLIHVLGQGGACVPDPAESVLNASLIGQQGAALIIGFEQLLPNTGHKEDERQGEYKPDTGDGEQRSSRAGPAPPFKPPGERREQVGKGNRCKKWNKYNLRPEEYEPPKDQDQQSGRNPSHPRDRGKC